MNLQDIKKQVWFGFVLVFLLFFSLASVSAQVDDVCVYEFYGQGCPHCGAVESHLETLEKAYPDLKIKRFEIYNNRSNLLVLQDYFETYNVPNEYRGVPIVFISDQYLVGDSPIINTLESLINAVGSAECPVINGINGTGEGGGKSGLEEIGFKFYLTIISAAFVDSINPCAIAVLLILMGALLLAADKRRAFLTGIAFTISIYIIYFLFGLGLFSALQISGLSYWFYKIVGAIAIVIGLANIKDYFWYGAGGFVMEIPRAWRPTLKGLLGKVTSPLGGFLMGFIVCFFELPCTGGPYLFVLGLLAERTTQLMAIPILLLYNLVFILPLIAITIILYFGYSSVGKTNEWKDKNIRMLHLIAGIVMLVLGLLVVFGLV
jgi:cytochrome c biogenesis protein CcdA/glutaredoxin